MTRTVLDHAGSVGDGLEHVIQKAISFTNIGMGMVVIAGAVVEDGVARVYERNRGQATLIGLLEKILVEF